MATQANRRGLHRGLVRRVVHLPRTRSQPRGFYRGGLRDFLIEIK